MTKICLVSDLHFNFSSPFDKVGTNGYSVRLDEILTSLTWAAKTGKEQGAEYFMILGDLFERADKLPTKEGQVILDCLTSISSMYDKKMIALVGNHDALSSDYNILNLFSATLTIINKPMFLDIPGARLFLCPYIREPEDFYATINKFTSGLDCLGKKYLFAHFWDTTVMGVDAEAIELSKINAQFFSRILTGHYHKPTNDLTNLVVYVGTLLNKKFSETGPKGCWVLDAPKNNLAFIHNPNSPEFLSTEDTVILNDPTLVEPSSYYRVACNAENIVDVSKLLSTAKGFEIVSKKSDDDKCSSVSIDSIEKRNLLTLKDFVFKNCGLYTPENVTESDFRARGLELLSDL